MRNETTVPVDATPEELWSVLVDVESWPELTESMTAVTKVDPGPLHVRSRVRITQPRLPKAEWTVTELVEPERFTWVASGPGYRSTATHEVLTGPGGTRLRLAVEQTGPLGVLLGRVLTRMVDRYIGLEAAGLKRRAEQAT
jgi:hypothetical protein